MISTSRRLAVGILAALPVLFIVLFGRGAAAAYAAVPSAPGALPVDAPTSLTVHRRDSALPLDQGNGLNPGGNLPGEPVAGVTFQAQQVLGVDLLTAAGWHQANQLSLAWSPQSPSFPAPLAAGVTAVTDHAGDARFTGLGVGLFLITETSTPAGRSPSIPFLVSLPMTHPDGASWLYDVWAAPKSDLINIDKTVSDSAAYGRGDVVTWFISADIPQSTDPLNQLTEFTITDELDPRLDLVRSANCGLRVQPVPTT